MSGFIYRTLELLYMATRLFGPRRRLVQAIEQITGKASSATAPPAATTTVNKQASSPSGTTSNENIKINDTEQEEHVCLSVGVFVCVHFISLLEYLS